MVDLGHAETDVLIEEIEKRIAKEYRQAIKEVQAKADDYFRRFEKKDAIKAKAVKDGIITEKDYLEWRKSQLLVGRKWQNLVRELSNEFHAANVRARAIINGETYEAFAINHNYATFLVEQQSTADTAYTLLNRDAVERIIAEQPDILPGPGQRMLGKIAKAMEEGRDIRWQAGQIQSLVTQALVQGESIPNMAKRLCNNLAATNVKSAIRYARTACTNAEGAGRYRAFERADALGIDMEMEWRATLDNRTRHNHRMLDGQRRKVGDPFTVYEDSGAVIEIDYPAELRCGESDVPQRMIWNCRCTILGRVAGWKSYSSLTRDTAIIGSYAEWKKGHSKPIPIDSQMKKGEAIKWAYIAEYKRLKNGKR